MVVCRILLLLLEGLQRLRLRSVLWLPTPEALGPPVNSNGTPRSNPQGSSGEGGILRGTQDLSSVTEK
ncbi:hypothetical protein MATL_G00170420 [Megalops atlanticus]|uniref:Secreted protein n=1 Tax=Megalops atlanticus TaxID=7932 RepID=A0A9D3PR84_MEGAT|nr:hypothetical protein MATL_G00170420 [Megalops atlanticus]